MPIYAPVPDGRGTIGRLTTALQRRLQLPLGFYFPLVALQGPYRRHIDGKWRPGRIWIGPACVEAGEHEERMFRNGVFFARLALPFCVCLSIRWGGGDPARKDHWDFVFGWRSTGIPGASFRVQSDASSAAGYDIANPGQAHGFNDGWR